MDTKIECLKLALEYAKMWNEHNKTHYKTEDGVIAIARKFYQFTNESNM